MYVAVTHRHRHTQTHRHRHRHRHTQTDTHSIHTCMVVDNWEDSINIMEMADNILLVSPRPTTRLSRQAQATMDNCDDNGSPSRPPDSSDTICDNSSYRANLPWTQHCACFQVNNTYTCTYTVYVHFLIKPTDIWRKDGWKHTRMYMHVHIQVSIQCKHLYTCMHVACAHTCILVLSDYISMLHT